jgi:hypothetical protein
MIRLGGSPYANQMPHIVATVEQTITEKRIADVGAAASSMI